MECQHDSHPEFHGRECACLGCVRDCFLDDPCSICTEPTLGPCVFLFKFDEEDEDGQ